MFLTLSWLKEKGDRRRPPGLSLFHHRAVFIQRERSVPSFRRRHTTDQTGGRRQGDREQVASTVRAKGLEKSAGATERRPVARHQAGRKVGPPG